MTDRELLELAAKAAGIELGWNKNDTPPKPFRLDTAEWWNPLTDDGDALRLAAKLAMLSTPGNGLSIFLHHDEVVVYGPEEAFLHKYGNDPYLAIRRAIVKTASEIGRSMT